MREVEVYKTQVQELENIRQALKHGVDSGVGGHCEAVQGAERASIDTFSIQHISDEIHICPFETCHNTTLDSKVKFIHIITPRQNTSPH